MYSQIVKGAVSTEVFKNRLRLRFRVGGERYCIYLGLMDTPENRKLALAKAKLIESDIISEQFDTTLNKYKPQNYLKVVKPGDDSKTVINLVELWTRYVEYKKPMVSPSTVLRDFGRVKAYLEKIPSVSLSDADQIRDWVVKQYAANSAKRFVVQINACCNWAVKSKLIDANPFAGMAAEIQLPKSPKKSELTDINPFTREERDAIIQAFKTNTYCHPSTAKYSRHSNYAGYVEFLFFTGCRPSEAIALQWKHITDRYVIFEQSVVDTEDGRQVKQGLKTEESRRFPINAQLRAIINGIKPENVSADNLVFPSPKGGYIDQHNFRNKIWEPLLKKMGIPYRKPYQTRHTFITLALEHIAIQDVARLSGNSPEVILKHYAGNRRDLQVPGL